MIQCPIAIGLLLLTREEPKPWSLTLHGHKYKGRNTFIIIFFLKKEIQQQQNKHESDTVALGTKPNAEENC